MDQQVQEGWQANVLPRLHLWSVAAEAFTDDVHNQHYKIKKSRLSHLPQENGALVQKKHDNMDYEYIAQRT